jgi:hypothetical protein
MLPNRKASKDGAAAVSEMARISRALYERSLNMGCFRCFLLEAVEISQKEIN